MKAQIVTLGFRHRHLSNLNAGGRVAPPRDESLNQVAEYYAANESIQRRMSRLLSAWDFGLSDVILRPHDSMTTNAQPSKQWYPFGVHQGSDGTSHILPLSEESSGTKTAFALLAPLLYVLEFGGVVALDELESDLHPHMIEPILDLFSNPETNPHGAQIIFTCHAVEVLRLLQKSQVMLVEKEGLESQAWRLDSMEGVRSDDNRVAKYLAGVYGAVPRL